MKIFRCLAEQGPSVKKASTEELARLLAGKQQECAELHTQLLALKQAHTTDGM